MNRLADEKDTPDEVKRLMEIVTTELRDHERRIATAEADIGALKTRIAINENDVKYVKDDLKAIKDNTTWILRLIVGGLIGGALALLFK